MLQTPPGLTPAAFSRLPLAIRRIAMRAADHDLEELARLSERIKGRASYFEASLPAFYANLDPTDIPHPEEPGGPVAAALLSLQLLYEAFSASSVPQELFRHLWLRMWPWMEFIHTNSLTNEAKNCVHFFLQIRQLQDDVHTADLIERTPGVRILVGRAWTFLLDAEISLGDEDGLLAIADVVGRFRQLSMHPLDPSDFQLHVEELIEGAGGTSTDFAQLIVRSFWAVLSDGDGALSEDNILLFQGLLVFLQSPQYHPYFPVEAFLACGIFKPLFCVVCALNIAPIPNVAVILNGCFDLVDWLVRNPTPVLPRIAAAVDAGLLRAIVSCGNGAAASVFLTYLKPMYGHLTIASIHYRPLRCIRNAMARTEDLAKTRRFSTSDVAFDWSDLLGILSPRFGLLEAFQSKQYHSDRACDNMSCGVIVRRPWFKRCGGCRRQYYCSESCQRTDWLTAGHRSVCRALSGGLCNSPDSLGTKREINFLRAILHQDYKRSKHNILFQQVAFMVKHPGVEFYTSFDYTIIPGPGVDIRPLPDESERDCETADFIARVARSGGLMELHRMSIGVGSSARDRWFPLRATGSWLHDRLRSIPDAFPGGSDIGGIRDQILESIRELDAEAEDELYEIH
ncbi:hypothetical protein C8R43DRAFT_1035933 [Mycena crocata]|nr:hypothetical protein C8R43DRAFT_1035933 [Mycena crocata]